MRKVISFGLFLLILSVTVYCSSMHHRTKTGWPPSNPTGPKRWAYGYTKIEYGLAVNHLGDTIKIKEFHQHKNTHL